jgi:hypothetical protein
VEVDSADDDVTAVAVSVPPESSLPEHAASSANAIAAAAVGLTPASLAHARRTIGAAVLRAKPRVSSGR